VKLLDRFLLRHFQRTLLLSLCAFIGIYLLFDFFEKIGDFIDHGATGADYLVYLTNSVPLICIQILPLAILMSVVLTIGGLSRTNEVTAMRACGVSLWKIVRPIMIFSLFLSGLLLLVNEFGAPHNARALNKLFEIKLKGKDRLSLTRDEIWFRNGNRIINVRLAEPAKQVLHGVSIFILDGNSHFRQRLDANQLNFKNHSWQARQLLVKKFDPTSGDLLSSETLSDQQLDLGRTPKDFTSQELQNNELNFRQLSRMVHKLELEGFDATRQRVDMHLRLASPFTCLIMAFLGIPFALQKGRRSNIALGIGLSLGIGVIYFILQSLLTAFGYSGALPPLVTAWATNVIFLMLGVWMLLSVRE